MSQELDSLVLFLQILIMKPISSWYQAVLVINKTILFSPWVKKNISHKVHIDIMNDWQIHVPADPHPPYLSNFWQSKDKKLDILKFDC